MAPRALGAALASVAALLIAVSLATSAWWNGHPTVDGHTITRKDVHIGLHGAQGCNIGETYECKALEIGGATRGLGFVELGLGVLALAGAGGLAFATWQQRRGKTGVARLAIGTAIAGAAGAIAVVIIGPQIKAEAAVGAPLGWGLFTFFAGVIAEGAAAVITLRDTGAPRRRVAAQAPATADVREQLRERHDGLRPSLRGGAGEPLFDGAPQLRPLYEMPGAVPIPPSQPVVTAAPPITPTPPPQPLPIAATSAPPPGFPQIVAAPFATPRPELAPPVIPPGPRTKTSSVAPPPAPSLPRNSPTISHAAVPPPVTNPDARPLRAQTDADEQTGVSDPPQPDREPELKRDRDTDVHELVPHKTPTPAPVTMRAPSPQASLEVGDSTDLVETVARPKFSAEELASIDAGTHRDPIAPPPKPAPAEPVAAPPPQRASSPPQRDSSPPQRDSVAPTIAIPRMSEPRISEPRISKPRISEIPISTAPASLPPPAANESTAAGPAPACPQCEAPMAWVEEHLRFYCKSCRMYF